MTITEVKRHLDGREERFECELLLKTDDTALVRFALHQDQPREDGPFRLPSGKIVTLAAFWEERPYLIYRLINQENQLIGHRFDVCEDVRIDAEIHYTDLLLDLWMPPGGSIYVLDQDEVNEAIHAGAMTADQASTVQRARRYLAEHALDVVRELDDLVMEANVAERPEQADHEAGD